MSEKPLVALPAMDKVTGVKAEGLELEIQWKSAGPPRFPTPEEIGPDTLYSVQLSEQQTRVLFGHLRGWLKYLDQWRKSQR